MKPGLIIRERRLIPVTTPTKNKKLESLLGNIQRSTLRDEILICALVSPDGNTGVFLDESGKEYLIKEKEFLDKISYITAKYVKKEVLKYQRTHRHIDEYEDVVKAFLERSDTSKRYKDWESAISDASDDEIEVESEEDERTDEEKGGIASYSGKEYSRKTNDGVYKVKAHSINGRVEYQVDFYHKYNPDSGVCVDIVKKLKDLEKYKEVKPLIPDIRNDLEAEGLSEETTSSNIAEKVDQNVKVVDALDESMSYGGYIIKWVSDKSGGKHVNVYKDGKFVASYDNEKEAMREIKSGAISELSEEYDPFKDLIKLPDDTKMKGGYFTDGKGGVYTSPKTGESKEITLSKYRALKGYKFAYSYKTNEIIMREGKKEVARFGLALSSWLDNPEYWCIVCADEVQKDLNEDKDYQVSKTMLKKLNKIAAKYSTWMEPKKFTKFYDEVGALGVEIDLISGLGKKSPMGGEQWTVGWSLDGKKVENSLFVYSVYKHEDSNKYEFNVYFS